MEGARVKRCLAPVLSLVFALAVIAAPRAFADEPQTVSGPLHTAGAKLLDAQGNEVRLTGVNWFGLETDTFAPHGLWARNYGDMLDQIVAAGFNTVRLPFSNQLLNPSSVPKSIDYQKNPDLQGLNGLQVMDRIITAAGERHLSIILDRHRPTASAQSELWYTPEVPDARWVADWAMLAQRYAGNATVIGADLHNEPHGPATWGDGNPATDWRLAAQRAGNAILAVNPDWLILVEGIEHNNGSSDWYWWGGNLAAARQAPVVLSAPDKLVYSPHDYGPGVYGQKWFSAPDFPANLPALWRDHWAFLEQDDIAPVLVGEFGGRSVGSDAEGVWQRSLLGFLRDNQLSYTYWAWNPDSGDTGGILADDWSKLDQSKLAMLEGYQFPVGTEPDATAGAAPTDVGATALQGQTTPAVTVGDTPPAVATTASQANAPVVAVGGVAADAPSPPAATTATTNGAPEFAAGGPYDPDIQHALAGVGGPNDPDAAHRQARERDERRYLAEFGKPWQYAVYVTRAG